MSVSIVPSPVQAIIRHGHTAVARVSLGLIGLIAAAFALSATAGGALGFAAEVLAVAAGVFVAWLITSFSTMTMIRNLGGRSTGDDATARLTRRLMLVPAGLLFTAGLWASNGSMTQLALMCAGIASFLGVCLVESVRDARS